MPNDSNGKWKGWLIFVIVLLLLGLVLFLLFSRKKCERYNEDDEDVVEQKELFTECTTCGA